MEVKNLVLERGRFQVHHGSQTSSVFVRLISHQPAVLFSLDKPATSNQPAVLFSQNKSAPAISHQPNEQAVGSGKTFGLVKNLSRLSFLLFITWLGRRI
jgi:hypothetical protein